MNVDLGIWGKLTRVVVVLLIAAGLLAVAVWYLPLIRKNERMRGDILNLEAQIQKEKEINKQLKASIDSFNDPKAVERLVRQKLHYAKPGEIVVRFDTNRTVLLP